MYIGTTDGGIQRFNLFSGRFEEPITRAQGLASNNIFSVYFDKATGILWALTAKGLENSGNREAQWSLIAWNEFGVRAVPRDVRIGSSNDYIWLHVGSSFYRFDHISGIQLGMSPGLSSENVTWSSRRLDSFSNESDVLMDYAVQDGWLYDLDRYMNSNGEYEEPVTLYFEDQFQQLWVGTDRGTILVGSIRSKYLTPYRIGIGNTDVTSVIFHDGSLWLGGRLNQVTRGITRVDHARGVSEFFDYGTWTGLYDQSIFTGKKIGNELWFGTDAGLLIFDVKDRVWTTLNENSGIRSGIILSIDGDTTGVWAGGSQGLVKVDPVTKTPLPDIINNSQGIFINDIGFFNQILWVVTDLAIIAYDTRNDKQVTFDQMNFEPYGNTSPIRFYNIDEDSGDVYLGASEGIFKYIPPGNSWQRVTEPGLYPQSRINDLAVNGDNCFVGMNDGFTVINHKTNWHRNYSYPFIGRVFQFVIENDIIWLGTDNGLIKFFWKKDTQ